MRIRIALTAAVVAIGMSSGIVMLAGTSPGGVGAAGAPVHFIPVHGSQLSPSALASFSMPLSFSVQNATPAVGAASTVTTATPTTAPAPPPPPPPPVTDATSVSTADWACIRVHESGDRYNDPSAPSGAYGILISTWRAFGYSGWPYQAPAAVQDALALKLYSLYGFDPWSSRYACGL